MLVHRRGLNRAKSLYMKVDENLNIADAKNVTPGTSTLTGTTTKGALQSKEGALQTRISQFQAGASKSTRDLNLTTDYAKGSLLKNVSTEISAKNGVLPEVLKDVMLARKFKQSPEFLTELATKTTSMKSIFKNMVTKLVMLI